MSDNTIYQVVNNQIKLVRWKMETNTDTLYLTSEQECDWFKERFPEDQQPTFSEITPEKQYEWLDGIPVNSKSEADEIFKNGENHYINTIYTPSIQESVIALSEVILPTVEDTDTRLKISGLFKEWSEGKYSVGDVFTAVGQVWEVIQEYDTSIYPDIYPMSNAWATFNRPYHGKFIETARPWVQPKNGTTDMYQKDEYMVYTDNKIYKCIAPNGTNFSPDEYAAGWEVQQ